MIRDAKKTELQQVTDYAYRLNLNPVHRCKAFPLDFNDISKQFEKMLAHPHDRLLIFEENNQICGVLALLADPHEKYLEAIGGVFAERKYHLVAKAFFDYIARSYSGYSMHAAYPEENEQAIKFMESIGAELEDSDYEMRIKKGEILVCCCCKDVMQLTERYFASFKEFHDAQHPNVFWTGEKLLDAQDKFRIHIVTENEKVIGSVVTSRQTEEIFFIAVVDDKQESAYGKPLLLQAVQDAFADGAEELLSMVERDNDSKINLFENLGFKRTDTCLTYKIRL
jgi:N-acetylglutamate synthase-like GNAT family acetyltransferase